MIYLDYAADTPVSPTVMDALTTALQNDNANPNAAHALGAAAQEALVRATGAIAAALGVAPETVVLTSGATEANNMAILGAARAYRGRGSHLITSPMEHASVTGPMSALKAEGFSLDFVKVRADGQVDLEHLRSLLRQDTVLLSLCAVDSEVGVLQPIAQVRQLLEEFPNCHLHVDATQAVGKLPLTFSDVPLFTLSPHKFYGITGTGVLVVQGGLRLAPLWHGGTGATPYRSGTPALALTVAVQAALEEAQRELPKRLALVRTLNRRLRDALAAVPFATLNSPEDASPYVLNFSVSGFRAQALLEQLSEAGVCVSSKSACCAPAAPSHPVLAMTGDRRRALNTVRVSLSHLTQDAEIDEFVTALMACAKRLEAEHGTKAAD